MVRLREEDIILELKAGSKEAVLRELAEVLHKHCPQVDLEHLCNVLREREMIGSTGVGNGVAIPHGKVRDLDHTLICFGRSQAGIHFESIDNQPVSLFVMILSPVKVSDSYLKTLARVSRLLKQPEKRRTLRLEQSRENIARLFNETD